MNKHNPECLVVSIVGVDEPGMLACMADIATEHLLDIEKATGVTLAGTVSLQARLSGGPEQLEAAQRVFEEKFRDFQVYADLREDPTLPTWRGQEMSPYLWKLTVHSPNARGTLKSITDVLKGQGIRIESYHGERYAPPDSQGHLASLQTCIIRVPIDFEEQALRGLLHEHAREALRANGGQVAFFKADLQPL